MAGRRTGLGGARSGLFWHAMRIAAELQPRWMVAENVDGLLSSTCTCPGNHACVRAGRAVRCGRWSKRHRIFIPHVLHNVDGGACPGGCMASHGGAMGTVVGAMVERGYGIAYRVLDAQYFGVAQRRNRLFLVGHLGGGDGPATVLLEPESSSGDSAAGSGPEQGTAGSAGGSAAVTGTIRSHPRPGSNSDGNIVAGTLQGGGNRGYRIGAEDAASNHLVSLALTAQMHRLDGTAETLIPFDRAQLTHPANWSNPKPGDPAPTLAETGQLYVAHSVMGEDVARPLRSAGHDASEDGTGRGTPIIAVPALAVPLTAGVAATPGVNEPGRRKEDDANIVAFAVAGDFSTGDDLAPTVRHGRGQPGNVSGPQMAARRLTPMECERLQGFPDGWTLAVWTAKGYKEQADAPRYRQLGNAVAVPVAQWIAVRIAAYENRNPRNVAASRAGHDGHRSAVHRDVAPPPQAADPAQVQHRRSR